MKTQETTTFTSSSAGDTQKFAKQIGQNLAGGEVIELIGDVGAGKTTFVRGLAAGIGSESRVSSPTFTIEQIYKGSVVLHHFDFYRLNQAGLITHELDEALEDPKSSVVIEWAKTVQDSLPKHRITIEFDVISESQRQLRVYLPPNSQLLKVAS